MERRTAPPPADGRPRQLGNGGLNKALMPAQAASLSPVKKYRGREKDGNRKAMARGSGRRRVLARRRIGAMKSEIHQHSAHAPVAQWIEDQPTDLGQVRPDASVITAAIPP